MRQSKNYAGIPDEFSQMEKAAVVLIPVPFDGTSTWGKGADKGPEAFLEASENMEVYDIETGTEVYRHGIYLAPPIEADEPEDLVDEVHDQVKDFIKRNKFVTLIGGEHSLSIGSIRAFNECFDDLTVLHIDAHADLRKTYDGTPYSHACAVHEASQTTNLVQVGIRSMDAIEKTYMDTERVFFAQEMATDEFWMDKVIDQLSDNVFITFDLDALDPSILPSTGTPEPGGLFWYETLDFLRQVFEEKNVVGFDIVELCPNPADRSSDFLAAKLYYKMLSYKFREDTPDGDADAGAGNAKPRPSGLASKYDEDDDY
ncbi:agmatinase [Robiginitalea sp. SC105]|uniref:agmatinase n=1 Tax=Robiginitalea sp. SC105 TaxID=2762332 RepID=UPI001639C48A|nr:agmatinase [Robiginitalea sp. SC105]MBC2838486.1 agmatinase [Robiginitalea sp. SC105]